MNPVIIAHRPRRLGVPCALDPDSRRAAQLNDRQMLSPFEVTDNKGERGSARSSDLRLRRCTSTSFRPQGPRLEAWHRVGRTHALVHFSRSSSLVGLARSVFIEPRDVER